MSDKRLKLFIYYPIILSVVLAGGMYLGSVLHFGYQDVNLVSPSPNGSKKISNLLNYVLEEYVDSVDMEGLTESTIIQMLDQLDPHSAYIPARDLAAMNEPLQGNFDGIGVEFNIINDSIVVVAPISGGPSDKLGIRSGDRIVTIEDSLVAGIKIQNKDVISLLRGERGTMVHVGIFRRGVKNLIDFEITRDKIPIYSVDAGYMINEEVGYIKISRFAATTFEEFEEKLHKLKKAGMKKLILDLRGNPGGYLNAAINISDSFLKNGELIVYTEGRARPKSSSFATVDGDFEDQGLAILIDEGSASASEIVAGAVQDNDRGTIIGRRSFGKGLVQEQADLPDGSAVRLTIARYYTPTGRCIQRPYGKEDDYYGDLFARYEHGELYEEDSVALDKTEKFTTPNGKVVYGGGGIMPDIFVPLDTTGYSAYHNRLVSTGIIREFALDLADSKREVVQGYPSVSDYQRSFHVSDTDYIQLVEFAKERDVTATNAETAFAKNAISQNIKALIARSEWNGEGYYPIINEGDKVIEAALKSLN